MLVWCVLGTVLFDNFPPLWRELLWRTRRRRLGQIGRSASFVLVHISFLVVSGINMDVSEPQIGQQRVRDEVGVRCQKLFQDFLEE
jgi:hypothetical protein